MFVMSHLIHPISFHPVLRCPPSCPVTCTLTCLFLAPSCWNNRNFWLHAARDHRHHHNSAAYSTLSYPAPNPSYCLHKSSLYPTHFTVTRHHHRHYHYHYHHHLSPSSLSSSQSSSPSHTITLTHYQYHHRHTSSSSPSHTISIIGSQHSISFKLFTALHSITTNCQ